MLAAIFFLSWQGLRPSAPKPVTAPASQFSAARALATLTRFMGKETPHPTGSDANTAVRERILREFSQIGYRPDVQNAFSCNEYGTCATVNNIVVRLEGRDKSAVLIAAHYDSVPAGPGASDDGAGVAAALEIARALRYLPTPRHSIIFLIDDGEEGWLLGARAFVELHPWAKDVRAAVNLDARGTSGPSLMFETGAANAWAAQLYARSVPHPATSSIFYVVYSQLPNDTDFTVFKAAGYEGLNFAFIDDLPKYHTPLDNIANVDPRSVQHQGDNTLPSLLALANANFSEIPQGEAVYFDLWERRVVRLSPQWAMVLGIISALLIAIEIGLLFRAARLNLRQLLLGLGAWLAIVAAAAVLGVVLRRLMQLGGAIPVDWIAYPPPIELAFWFLGISVAITVAVLFARSCGFWGLWAGVWAWWALLALITVGEARGTSYVLLLPAAMAAVFSLPCILRQGTGVDEILARWAVMPPLAAAGILGFPVALLLYDGLGNRALPAIASLVALLFTPTLPFCVDFLEIRSAQGIALFWTPAVLAFSASFAAILAPAYSATAPEHVNIEYWRDADTGKSQWIVQPASGRLPEPVRVAASFQPADKGPFPWDASPAFLAPASSENAAAPTLTILESTALAGRRNYRSLLRSERGAPDVMVLFPPGTDATAVRMNGRGAAAGIGKAHDFFGGWKIYRCLTTPAEGVEIAFSLPLGKPLEVYALDATYGLPSEGKFLLSARPITATPFQNGDVTIVSRRVQLIP
jgi:hypothetical protein